MLQRFLLIVEATRVMIGMGLSPSWAAETNAPFAAAAHSKARLKTLISLASKMRRPRRPKSRKTPAI